MSSKRNQQVTLKPQDLVVAMKLAVSGDQPLTYARLARELGMSASEVHASAQRCQLAQLATVSETGALKALRPAVLEFAIHGARYAFPAQRGPVTRGVPTAYAAPPLNDRIRAGDEPPPVWPSSTGTVRGAAVHPLYPSVPEAARQDAALYELLSLFDALRIGAARERNMAERLLEQRLA
jgi:hypothetical protein